MTDTTPPPMTATDHDTAAADHHSQAAAFTALAGRVDRDPRLKQMLAAVGAQHLASGPITPDSLRAAAQEAADTALVHKTTAECRRRSPDRAPCSCGHRDNQHEFHLTAAHTIPCRYCNCPDYRPAPTQARSTLGPAREASPEGLVHHDH